MVRPSEEAMTPINPPIITERKKHDWLVSALVVWFECAVFVTMGYFARPVIDSWIARWL